MLHNLFLSDFPCGTKAVSVVTVQSLCIIVANTKLESTLLMSACQSETFSKPIVSILSFLHQCHVSTVDCIILSVSLWTSAANLT